MRSQETSFEIPESRYLHSGQFAALCRTTKETLRHYRDIGLIEPVFMANNGYACYSPLQLGDFMLVTALQRAGSSLADIGRYLEDPQEAELEAIIEKSVERLETERRALDAQRRFLQKTLERSRALAQWREVEEGWRLVDLEEERFFETDLSGLFAAEEPGADGRPKVEELVDDELFLMDQGLANQMQGSYRVGLQALLDGHPENDFHLCIAAAPAGRTRTRHTRPAGRYFQRLRCASIDEMLASGEPYFQAYFQLLEEVRERGFEPIGDVYEQELSLYTGDIAAEAYTELSVQVDGG